jgi:hypothetical protein
MWTDLKTAARDGLVVGVKLAVATLVILFAVSWFLGDYVVLRQQARNGQIAFDRQQQVLRQQQAAAAATPTQKEK